MDRFFNLLKEKYPLKSDVLTEIINLEAIQHLPKETEYFVSDLHGEYVAFDYILRNGSGTIKQKIKEYYRSEKLKLSVDIDEFCKYIYYPEEKIKIESKKLTYQNLETELLDLVPCLIRTIQLIGAKYTRSKVRKRFPQKFAYIIEELLVETEQSKDKDNYVQSILNKVRSLSCLEELVISLSYIIQHLAVDHLHVVGDIYDRGSRPDDILDRLIQLPSVDIQWGNHDISWMGARSGSYVCMMNVIRISTRYNNLSLLENRYGINLRPLLEYSRKYYQPVDNFTPILDGEQQDLEEKRLLNQVQHASAVLQFKLEEQLIKRRPEFHLSHRQLLDKIDFKNKTIQLKGKIYNLKDFPSDLFQIDCPEKLSQEEERLLEQLMYSFQNSERLARHIDFLFSKGSMYLVYNNNLLFHGCIPLHPNGDFKSLKIGRQSYSGKTLLDFYEKTIHESYRNIETYNDFSTDLYWYLWGGENSSLFGKRSMTTFERYYIDDLEVHVEERDPYYKLRNQEMVCKEILFHFGLDEKGHIINGHTPVEEKKGESPIKANARLLVIDGGFAKGYQKKTGIAGYTLVFNSYGLQIMAHPPFTSVENVLEGSCDIILTKRLVEKLENRILVRDTNVGHNIQQEINDLEYLYKNF